MVIRKPSHHDRLIGTDKLDAEPFQFWTKQHVSHKYPSADEPVIDRISGAMARQRAILKYRERHHAKLSQGIHPEKDDKTAELSETVVSVMYQELGKVDDVASDTGAPETSYVATLLGGEGKMTIPPMPKEGANRTPFECPYCFFIITIRDSREWARHIFRDLMPYVCILPLCPTPNKLYESRRQWFHHIRETHDLEPAAGGAYVCSICKQVSISELIFERHVGQHLEELALFVLPRTTSDDDVGLEIDVEESSQNIEGSVSETAEPDHGDYCQQNEQDATVRAAAEDQVRSRVHFKCVKCVKCDESWRDRGSFTQHVKETHHISAKYHCPEPGCSKDA